METQIGLTRLVRTAQKKREGDMPSRRPFFNTLLQ